MSAESGRFCADRGGSWTFDARYARVACCRAYDLSHRISYVSFRLVLRRA